ncbi:MAG: TatD family hydrolase [Pseudomonadales bacterium]|nr:TatD family hydrolase [Pseudomonadales bacterium]
MFADSHCHLDRLDLSLYHEKLDGAVDAATAEKVTRMLCVSTALESFDDIYRLTQVYPQVVASVGVHPLSQDSREPTLEELVEHATLPKVVAIGETGLDYYYCKGDLDWQRERFKTHIQAAVKSHKPLIIHTRDAKEDTLKLLIEGNAQEAGGVLHCFTEDLDMANRAIEMGFYISFSGILTFRNADDLRAVAKQMPMDRILIETDSPYLAPIPYRGKPNEPKYVGKVAECLAELKNLSVESIAAQTMDNYCQLFSIES